MTIADDIINRRMPAFDYYVQAGESLDDIDEYGFTPLIEAVITRQIEIAKELLKRQVDINKVDVAGSTALHWAVDNQDLDMARLLLEFGANANAYTRNGLSILVYPVLRGNDNLKHLLYQHGAKLEFAQDFIRGKLIGHRFELQGDVDIVNAEGEFIELDYEGFMLEFTVAVLKDSIRRFVSSYSTRHLRAIFPYFYEMMDAFHIAEELLRMQRHPELSKTHWQALEVYSQANLLILPAASRGHAMGFVRFGPWWAKIDRGENSQKEGSVNIYRITKSQAFDANFIQQFLLKKQSRAFFHQKINQILGLEPVAKMPMSSQISGNCSWANIQAIIPVAYALQQLSESSSLNFEEALNVYGQWVEWDKDRALEECIQNFYSASPARKASIAAMFGSVLFYTCVATEPKHLERAEKILTILTLPEYYYVLKSYLEEFCVKRLTKKGNNLLKILDDCGVNPNIGVNYVATGY